MTRLGRMLYDDGKVDGEKRGESKILTLIQKMTADGALESIPRLATDSEFFQAMAKKYSVDI